MKDPSVLFLFIMMLIIAPASHSDKLIEPVSEYDFKVVSNDGKTLSLLEDIDSVLAKFNLTFYGICNDNKNPALDVFLYQNDDLKLYSYRKWQNVNSITLKNDKLYLNRGIRVGDTEESLKSKFQYVELFKLKDKGWYVRYSSDDPESKYIYSVGINFETRNGVITKIVLWSSHE